MAIRISGMISGMDTDAMVKELVSAYQTKTDKYKKAQTKLEWKQDAWKELNSKIYKLYTNMFNRTLSSNYNKKKTVSSDESKASVVAANGSVIGTQKLKIKSLATSGYLTGAELGGGTKGFTSDSTLGELGISDKTSIDVTIGGKRETIELDSSMKVRDLVKEFSDKGLVASFDEKNQRFFVSSKNSGKDGDFEITGTQNAAGSSDALKALGFVSNLTGAKVQKKVYGGNVTGETKLSDIIDKFESDSSSSLGINGDINFKVTVGGVSTDVKLNKDMTVDEMLEELKKTNLSVDFDEENQSFSVSGGSISATDENSTKMLELLGFNKATSTSKLSDLGVTSDTTINVKVDGKTTKVELKADMTISQMLEELNKAGIAGSFDQATQRFSISSKTNGDFDISATGDAGSTETLKALGFIAGNGESPVKTGPVKIEGQDAEIELNGATFRSNTNSFSINGLTITAKAETAENETITLSTDTDVDAVYDSIKEFIKEYNELIKEMDTLYNAKSAKGYEPLTDEEKDSMSDTEVEKWETKIKDSLLRRDGTLSSVITIMKTAMQKSFTINGETLSLSSFGIETGGYFDTGENEKGMYHIDGDPDDSTTKGNADKLKTMIASDPDKVASFFSQLSKNLYDELGKKMSSTRLSSAFTVYNDKQMKTEYDNYTKTIKKWEDYVSEQEDKWYKKFSAMETALAKLQSSTSALSGLLGS